MQKRNPYKSRKLLDRIGELPCVRCGKDDGTTVGAVLVIPVDMLAKLTDRFKANIEKRKKDNEQLDLY